MNAQDILDTLDGATVAHSFVEDENGLHIVLADGRILVIVGEFAVAIVGKEKLH